MRHKRIQVRQKPTYRVRCADGLTMPWPTGAVVVEGVRPTIFTPETVVTVADSLVVRRRIAAGDMVLVDAPASKPKAKKSKAKKEE